MSKRVQTVGMLLALTSMAIGGSSTAYAGTVTASNAAQNMAQWKFSGDKHKSLQVDTERTFHQRYPLAML